MTEPHPTAWPPSGVSVLCGANGSGKFRALMRAGVSTYSPGNLSNDVWHSLSRRKRDEPSVFAWIVETVRSAFPGMLRSLEVDRRDDDDSWAPGRVQDEDGNWSGGHGAIEDALLVLAAAWEAWNTPIAFRRFGEGWHPHAIRTIVHALRRRHEDLSTLTSDELVDLGLEPDAGARIVLVTYSPIVLNMFRDEPEHVFEMRNVEPCRLTDLHDDVWLAQSKLGTLFDQLAIGAPPLSQKE